MPSRRSRSTTTGWRQARVELPKFLKSRLALGAQARWQDFRPQSTTSASARIPPIDSMSVYGIESTQLTAYATLRPFRWMDIGGQIGWMNPDSRHTSRARSCRGS